MVRPRGGKRVDPQGLASMRSELEALKILQPSAHPHIANLRDFFESRYQVHAVLQYCGGGSLSRFLGQLKTQGLGMTETDAAALTIQLSGALAHMHSFGVAHRDIKPDNCVFVDANRCTIKVVDFGFAACRVGERRLRTICGTPSYMAPELVRKGSYLGA